MGDRPVSKTSTWQHTEHSKHAYIHTSGGIQTRNSSKRAAADPYLRPPGHQDRPLHVLTAYCFNGYCCIILHFLVGWKVKYLHKISAVFLTSRCQCQVSLTYLTILQHPADLYKLQDLFLWNVFALPSATHLGPYVLLLRFFLFLNMHLQ